MRVTLLSVLFFICLFGFSQQRDWIITISAIEPFPTLTILSGDSVTWMNNDDRNHTITSTVDSFPSSDVLRAGDNFTITLNGNGTYSYACSFHPIMKGKVLVTEVEEYDDPVKFSRSIDYPDPLPGFSFTEIEGVSTVFEITPNVFGVSASLLPSPLGLPSSYFVSPLPYLYGEDNGSNLLIVNVFIALLCLVVVLL